MPAEDRRKWDAFFGQLDAAIAGKVKFTVVLEDPLASSYVQSFTAPEPDPQVKVEDYERTDEEEEDLGLKDIKTEGYEQPEPEENGVKENAVEGKSEGVLAMATGKMTLEEREHETSA